MINKSITQLISMTRLENLQWAKEMTIQQDADYNSFITVSLNNYQLIATDLSKQKPLDTDPMDIQRIEFKGEFTKKNTHIYYC